MARAGWLFSRHGMVLSRIGVHTCFIRYYQGILGSRLTVDCFVIYFIFAYFFLSLLPQPAEFGAGEGVPFSLS